VVAVTATVAAMTMAFSVPAMADVDFVGDKRGDRYEDRHHRYEDRIDEYYDELEDAYDEAGFFYYAPFTLYDVDSIEDIEDVLDLD
jgi:hypothetical protein